MNFYHKKEYHFPVKQLLSLNMSNSLLKSNQPDSRALLVQLYPRKSLSRLEEARFLASSQGDD